MNHVIATKIMWKLSTIFLLFILKINFCYSQIIEIEKEDTAEINIPKIMGDKINAFIFIKADNKSRKTSKFENNLDILEFLEKIDFTKFNIYKFIITTHPVCAKNPPKLTLDGYEMPTKFELDPYYILVETGKVYEELSKIKLDTVATKTIIVAPNRDSKNSPFLLYKEDGVFINLIKKFDNSVSDRTLKEEIKKIKDEMNLLKIRSDSLEKINARRKLFGLF